LLFRIAINEVHQYHRKQKKERHIHIEECHFLDFQDKFQSSSQEVNTDLLFEALNILSDSQMQLIELRFFEKRSFKNMAEILDITENNAKVKTHRVLKKLKKQLKKNGFSGNMLNLLMSL